MRVRAIMGCLLCVLLALALGAAPAQASRELLSKKAVETKETPVPEEEIEGACGAAVGTGGTLYVSDYHHHAIDVFVPPAFPQQPYEGILPIKVAGAFPASPEGPCGLALDSSGNLYVNLWHESVIRQTPTRQVFDTGKSTGVAVDTAGNVYVNDRTYVAVYEPSGAPVLDEGQPLRIGSGSLGNAYGLAVAGKRVYVPDASDHTVKVFEPSVELTEPVDTITGAATAPHRFVSLVDAAVAVDPTNGHLLVLDNLQPGYEHPIAVVYEFDSSGNFLDQLSGEPIDGEPSGMAVDPTTGRLFVTTGNDENSNVFAYGPYTALGSPSAQLPGEAPLSASGVTPADRGQGSSDLSQAAAMPSARQPTRHRHVRRHRFHRATRLGPAKAASRR